MNIVKLFIIIFSININYVVAQLCVKVSFLEKNHPCPNCKLYIIHDKEIILLKKGNGYLYIDTSYIKDSIEFLVRSGRKNVSFFLMEAIFNEKYKIDNCLEWNFFLSKNKESILIDDKKYYFKYKLDIKYNGIVNSTLFN